MKLRSMFFIASIFSASLVQAIAPDNALKQSQMPAESTQQRLGGYHIIINAPNKSGSAQESEQEAKHVSTPSTKVETAIVQQVQSERQDDSNIATHIAAVYCPLCVLVYKLFSK